jgi:hypothetical protein
LPINTKIYCSTVYKPESKAKKLIEQLELIDEAQDLYERKVFLQQ